LLPPIRHDVKENATLEGQLKATLIVSQVPVAYCHLRFSDHTLADAILYRTIHNAYRLSLLVESQRKLRGNLKNLLWGNLVIIIPTISNMPLPCMYSEADLF
jgi:hypothetical protein